MPLKSILKLQFLIGVVAVFVLDCPAKAATEDTCPFPCFPTPTGLVSSGQPASNPPPSPPSSQSGWFNYSPPVSDSVYSPQVPGNSPYYYLYPPTSSHGDSITPPPPPDQILPYFPFYYRKPPHQPLSDQFSEARALRESTTVAGVVVFLLSVFLL